MSKRLTADLRMARHSGIGRYLRNLVPLLLPQLHAEHIRLLGRRELFGNVAHSNEARLNEARPNEDRLNEIRLNEVWLSDPRLEWVEERAPIYSIAEQTMGLRGRFAPTDLLWVPHYNAPLFYSGKLVVTLHDIAPIALPEILNSGLKRAYARLLIERACTQASALLCVSEFTRAELRNRLRVPDAKLHVTHPGLDTNWPTHAEPHREPGLTPYILFVGNVKPNKNLALLLAAFRQVLDRVPFRLLLAGRVDGFRTADEQTVRDARSFGDRVCFIGEVADPELQRLYAGASALCLPSKYEGFGLPLLEAMALGCPVLCSTAGSLPEVAGDAALTFSPDSATELAACLLRVLDPATMDDLRLRGRLRLQSFSFATCAQQTAAVMNDLLGAA